MVKSPSESWSAIPGLTSLVLIIVSSLAVAGPGR
jgi:hypothetical protein